MAAGRSWWRASVLAAVLITTAFAEARTKAAELSAEPVVIGSRLELFVDRHLVDQLLGRARFELHHPRLSERGENPQPESPWGNVFKEGDTYKMLVRGFKDPKVSWKTHSLDAHYRNHILLYYEGADGIDWKTPNLGLYDLPSHPAGNVIMVDQFGVEQTFAAFRDTRAGVPDGERYKGLGGKHYPDRVRDEYFAEYGRHGLRAYASPDAIHWKRLQSEPVIPGDWGALDSQNVVFWSEHEQRYVCYFRVTDNRFTPGVRSVRRTTSKDFLHWSEPQDVRMNLPGEHLYTSNIEPYFRAPHVYIGLPTRFMRNRGSSTDILFVSSRDGLGFDRVVKDAFIRPGLERAAWGNRANYAAYHIIPTSKEEISIYVSGGRRYTLRTDGFVSINAPHEGGELITKPLIFEGERLVVNYSSSAAGCVKVEIQDAHGRPVRGYTLEECRQIVGDEIERTVEWNGDAGRDVSKLAGKPIRLRFVMQDADLFSFHFRGAAPR